MILGPYFSRIRVAQSLPGEGDREGLVMGPQERLRDEDHQILGLLDDHPQGLTLEQIDSDFSWDVKPVVQHLLKVGFLERTPRGMFRTLG